MKVHYKGFDAKFEFEPGDVNLVCGCVINTKRKTVDWSCEVHDEWCADRISDACAE
jgi:hypothetical protein